MDSLTQIVLGIGVAHLCLGEKVNRRKKVALGAVVGTLPDLDIYFAKFFNDPLTEVEIHRGFSHSIVFFVLLSFLITFLVKKWSGGISKKLLFYTIFLVLFTHSLLDIFTTWGTQLFWPFPEKIALKSIFVVDFFYTIPLAIAVFLGIKYRNKNYTLIGFFLSTLYLTWGLCVQNFVKNKAKEAFLLAFSSEILQITAKPTFSNSFLWNVILQDQNGFYLADFSIFDKEKMTFSYFPQNKQLIAKYNDKNIDRLIRISENQYTISQNKSGLIFNDLRFGLLKKEPEQVQFAFSYQLIPTPSGFKIQEVPKDKRDGAKLLKNIWNRIF